MPGAAQPSNSGPQGAKAPRWDPLPKSELQATEKAAAIAALEGLGI